MLMPAEGLIELPRNARAERGLWHDSRLTPSLGCTACPNRKVCGGLQVMRDPNARIQWAHPAMRKQPLDPLLILDRLAHDCSRAEDLTFWILTSAAAHLNGYNLDDGQGSTVAVWVAWQDSLAQDGRLPVAAGKGKQ